MMESRYLYAAFLVVLIFYLALFSHLLWVAA